jgi:hypothetical protein
MNHHESTDRPVAHHAINDARSGWHESIVRGMIWVMRCVHRAQR